MPWGGSRRLLREWWCYIGGGGSHTGGTRRRRTCASPSSSSDTNQGLATQSRGGLGGVVKTEDLGMDGALEKGQRCLGV